MTNPKIEAIKNQVRDLMLELTVLDLTDLQYALDELSDEAAAKANECFEIQEAIADLTTTW
jgi:hypothetical protein